MSKYKFSQREKKILAASFLMVLVFILYRFIFMPLSEKERVLYARIKVAENKLLKANIQVHKVKKFQEGAEPLVEPFKQKGPKEAVMSSILSAIESAANMGDVTLADLKPEKVKTGDFYSQFSVNLSVEGKLEEVVKFIHHLQNPPHNFLIDELSMDVRSARAEDIKTRLVVSRVFISQ